MDSLRVGTSTINLVQGDITKQQVAAIVNAANSSLLGGGGVDGAIHRNGGPTILEECKRIRATRFPSGLPTGEAVSTSAGALAAQRVIHTVGPIWRGGINEPAALANAYHNSLACARAEGLRRIAFPSISTGAYGYPVAEAATLALSTVRSFLQEHDGEFDEVRFVLFSDADLQTYQRALEHIASE